MADIRTEFNDYRFGDIIYGALIKMLERNDAKERENKEESRWQTEQAFREKDYQAKLDDYRRNREYQNDMFKEQQKVTSSTLETNKIAQDTQRLNNALNIRKEWTSNVPEGFKGFSLTGAEIEALPGGSPDWFIGDEDNRQWYRTADVDAYNDTLLRRAQQGAASSTIEKNRFELELMKQQQRDAQKLKEEYQKSGSFRDMWAQEKVGRIRGKLEAGDVNYFSHLQKDSAPLSLGNPLYDMFAASIKTADPKAVVRDTYDAFSAAKGLTTEIDRLMNLQIRSPQANAQLTSLLADLQTMLMGESVDNKGNKIVSKEAGLLNQIMNDARDVTIVDPKQWNKFKQEYANLQRKYNNYINAFKINK